MKRSTTIGLCTLALATGIIFSQSDALAARDTASAALPVGTCINMGNMLEPEREGMWGGAPIAAEDFARIKAAGFETVRIPVRWHNKTLQ